MELLTLIAQADGSMLEKVVAGVVIYFVARREVRKQFDETRQELKNIAAALKGFGEEIVELESKHDARITKLETRSTRIEVDLENFKQVIQKPREV